LAERTMLEYNSASALSYPQIKESNVRLKIQIYHSEDAIYEMKFNDVDSLEISK
jgi:hypothetical protein